MQSNQSSAVPNKVTKLKHKSNLMQSIDICYVGSDFIDSLATKLYSEFNFNVDIFADAESLLGFMSKITLKEAPGAILLEAESEGVSDIISKLRSNPLVSGIIVILLNRNKDLTSVLISQKYSANDIYYYPFNPEIIAERINFLIKVKLLKSSEDLKFSTLPVQYKPPVLSRIFSFSVALILIILLSPLLLLTALIIRLESKGPIIYKSKRAGTGYQVFDFYKFRSMVAGADEKLETLSKTQNQYTSGDQANQAFVKILNDPRITKFGKLIRKTSIDELPQLFNVLKGDMMLVGNRPLPLYEAEMLTSDEFALRFLGPAGITGLWQISKRGKAEMSDTERKHLDNDYAKHRSFLGDIKIMLKTVPAMLQKENV